MARGSCDRGLIPGGAGQVSNVVFMGMGEPLANYKAVVGAVRQLVTPTPDGLGLSARGVTVSHGRAGAADAAAGHRGDAGDARPVVARAGRRAARRAGPDQHPVERRRGGQRGLGVRPDHQAAGLHRVHPDPRRERPAVPGRSAGQGAAAAGQLGLGARQPDPDEPDTRLTLDRLPAPGRERVRPPARAQGRAGHRTRHPRAARSTAPAVSSPRTPTWASAAAARRGRPAEPATPTTGWPPAASAAPPDRSSRGPAAPRR